MLPLVAGRLLQADLPATAKIELQAAKHGRRARQLHGNLSNGLLWSEAKGFRDGGFQGGVHAEFPKKFIKNEFIAIMNIHLKYFI